MNIAVLREDFAQGRLLLLVELAHGENHRRCVHVGMFAQLFIAWPSTMLSTQHDTQFRNGINI